MVSVSNKLASTGHRLKKKKTCINAIYANKLDKCEEFRIGEGPYGPNQLYKKQNLNWYERWIGFAQGNG